MEAIKAYVTANAEAFEKTLVQLQTNMEQLKNISEENAIKYNQMNEQCIEIEKIIKEIKTLQGEENVTTTETT